MDERGDTQTRTGPRVRVAVELIEAGAAGETRMLELDVATAGERSGGGWLLAFVGVAVAPVLVWCGRRAPRLVAGQR